MSESEALEWPATRDGAKNLSPLYFGPACVNALKAKTLEVNMSGDAQRFVLKAGPGVERN